MENIGPYLKAWRKMVNGPAEVTTMQRTNQQNKSLQKGCELLAGQFNDAGLDMRKVLKPEVDIPWTRDSIREQMFNPISIIMHDGRTSSQLDTKEIKEVWAVVNRFTGEKHGITQEWPSEESLSEEQREA
jgi:hypothetical protein